MKIDKIVVGYLEENCYILTKNNHSLIIDPGDEGNKIIKFIKNNNLNISGILITHAHFDHIGALNDILKEYNVPVYYYNINNELKENIINLEEKEYVIDDFKFKVIYSPGHRNDSVTYYFYEEEIMFSGDFIFYLSVGRTDLEYGNYEEMIKSIIKIKKYRNDIIVYPGHGQKTILGFEKANNSFFM